MQKYKWNKFTLSLPLNVTTVTVLSSKFTMLVFCSSLIGEHNWKTQLSTVLSGFYNVHVKYLRFKAACIDLLHHG